MKKIIKFLNQLPDELNYSPLWLGVISKLFSIQGFKDSCISEPFLEKVHNEYAIAVVWNDKTFYFCGSSSSFNEVFVYQSIEDWENNRNFLIVDNLDQIVKLF